MDWLKNLWFFIRPYLGVVLKEAGALLKDIALAAVAQAMSREGLSNDQRRALAIDIAKTQLMARGVQVADRLISGAVEAALDKLKRDYPEGI